MDVFEFLRLRDQAHSRVAEFIRSQLKVLDVLEIGGVDEDLHGFGGEAVVGDDQAGDLADRLELRDQAGEVDRVVLFLLAVFGKNVGVLQFEDLFVLDALKQGFCRGVNWSPTSP